MTAARSELERIELPEYTDEIYHGYLARRPSWVDLRLPCYGPYDPANGHRFNPNKLLIDPYAKQLVGQVEMVRSPVRLHHRPPRRRPQFR